MNFMLIRSLLFGCLISLYTLSAQAGNLDFALGKALFDRPWSSAPASTQATDGLGPLFNARSCLACHPKAGRGEISKKEDGTIGGIGYVIRLGNEKGSGDPVYGRQFQTNAIPGKTIEGQVKLIDAYYKLENLGYGPLDDTTNIAGRLSQPLHGLGLLERVSDETIIALADPDDKDKDGVSGRVHWVDGQVGRFAWKATAPTLYVQAANAFHSDIGMSTPVHPTHWGDCTPAQEDCQMGPHGDSPQFEGLEIDTQMLMFVTRYLQGLKPPKAKPTEGLAIFKSVGCASCHIPSLPLSDGGEVHAFTDLLLHDMGDGLSDGIREGNAAPNEWRTQPLWGTSQTKQFLHDGRASSVAEAISWHGGEARGAKERFNQLSNDDKNKLLAFVNSL